MEDTVDILRGGMAVEEKAAVIHAGIRALTLLKQYLLPPHEMPVFMHHSLPVCLHLQHSVTGGNLEQDFAIWLRILSLKLELRLMFSRLRCGKGGELLKEF